MRKLIIGALTALTFGCGSNVADNYPMEKRYWDIADYDAAVRQLQFFTSEEEGYPRLSDPETAPVFNKLVDKQNVSVVLEDDHLGLQHRSNLATEFFNSARTIIRTYRVLDRQDKFVYPVELQKAIEFSLHTQLLYFKLGNDVIIKDAIDPEASDIKRLIRSNEQTIADNFNIYIEMLTKESAFNDDALTAYAKMIDQYYTRLLKEFPLANYSGIKSAAQKINNKATNPEIKQALTGLIAKIDEKNS